MNKVWIVSYEDYDQFEILGVFNHQEKAEQFLKQTAESYYPPFRACLYLNKYEVK